MTDTWPGSDQIRPGVLAGPNQGAGGFLLERGQGHRAGLAHV
jgi:hypothetical protein